MRVTIRATLACLGVAIAASGVRAAEPPAELSPGPRESLYLEIFINGIDQHVIGRLDRRGDQLYIDVDELGEIGLKPDGLRIGGDRTVALRDIPAVSYDYRPLEQRLDLVVPSSRLIPEMLGYTEPSATPPRSDIGVVINYALQLQREDLPLQSVTSRVLFPLSVSGRSAAGIYKESEQGSAYSQRNKTAVLDGDVRVFAPFGLFINRYYTTYEEGEAETTRLDSYWRYDALDPARSYVVGDFISASLPWTRSLRLGGMSIAREFDVRPDLVTFPVPALGGTAVVPTTVDLYVNGIRQFSGASTIGGPFVLSQPPVLTGAGTATLVYRDALGREVRTTQPLYVDTRLLAKGLSDYAYQIGYPRRNYGTEPSDYAPDAAGTASLRYGFTDAFTFEAHAEATAGLENVGVGGLFKAGRFGVLSASVAVGDADGRGKQISAGYQYVAPRWSFDVYSRHADDDYADLGTLENVPIEKALERASLTLAFRGGHTVSINYTQTDDPSQTLKSVQKLSATGTSRVVALGYSSSWGGSRYTTFANVFRDTELPSSDGAYLAFTVNLGKRTSMYSGASRYDNEDTVVLGTGRPVDYDLGGFGYDLYSETGNDDYRRNSLRVDYRNRFGDWSASWQESSDASGDLTNMSLFGAGALIVLGREVMPARPVYDGFALVSTSGMAGVPVERENRPIGRTNRHGYLLVPDLPSYRTTRLAIDPLVLPLDVSAPVDRLEVSPREQSGLIARFPLDIFRGATLVLVDETGAFLPAGTRMTLIDTGDSALMGYDGQVFFGSLQPANRVQADLGDSPCVADVRFELAQSMRILGPFVCTRAASR